MRVRSGCCAAPNEASHPLLLRPTLGIAMRPAPAAPALNAVSEIRSCCPPASSASGRRPGTNAAEGADAAAVAPLRTARASLAPKATIKCQNLHSRGQRRSMLPKPNSPWHGTGRNWEKLEIGRSLHQRIGSKKKEEEVCYRGGQAIALERVTCPSFSSRIMRTR